MNKTLRQIFEENKDKKFYFHTVLDGNHGDKLIHEGAKNLAREVGLNFCDLNINVYENEIQKDDIIYVQGCGGVGNPYFHIPFGVFALQCQFPDNKIILGPTSFMLCPELKYAFDNKNLTIFAREEESYKFFKGLNLNIENLFIDKCTSLYYIPDTKKEKIIYKKALFSRTDEAVPIPKEINQTDYSLIVDAASVNDFETWVKIHKQSEEIVTNRLHSAILGVLLGKKVKLFKNFYHKNYSMWKYCLKDLGVEWIGKPWIVKEVLLISADKMNFKKK